MPLKNFTRWYGKQLDKRPIITKCFTASGLNLIGDTMCQHLEKMNTSEKWHYNKKRTFSFMSLGFLYGAPMLHLNYTKILPALAPDGVKF